MTDKHGFTLLQPKTAQMSASTTTRDVGQSRSFGRAYDTSRSAQPTWAFLTSSTGRPIDLRLANLVSVQASGQTTLMTHVSLRTGNNISSRALTIAHGKFASKQSDDEAGSRKIRRVVRTASVDWAIVSIESAAELPAAAIAYSRSLAIALRDVCRELDRLGFHEAALAIHQRDALPGAVATLLGGAARTSSVSFSNDDRAGNVACAVLVGHARALQFTDLPMQPDASALYNLSTGLIVIPVQRSVEGWLKVASLATTPSGIGLCAHEVFHGVQETKIPSIVALASRADARRTRSWKWVREGTASAIQFKFSVTPTRDEIGEIRALIRWNFARDWFEPLDAAGLTDNNNFLEYLAGVVFLTADAGDVRYLSTFMGRLELDLQQVGELPENCYAAVDHALDRRGFAPGLVRPFRGGRGGGAVVSRLAAAFARAIATCGRYDPLMTDDENWILNRGRLDGFGNFIDANHERRIGGRLEPFPLLNMAADGRAYWYDGGGRVRGVRITLNPNWNPRLYLMVGEGATSEADLWFVNTPGAVIDIPWVPTRVRPLVVSILHIDIAAGPDAPPLGWGYRVEMT